MKWLGVSLQMELICPLMMGMILASGSPTADRLHTHTHTRGRQDGHERG